MSIRKILSSVKASGHVASSDGQSLGKREENNETERPRNFKDARAQYPAFILACSGKQFLPRQLHPSKDVGGWRSDQNISETKSVPTTQHPRATRLGGNEERNLALLISFY